MSICTQNLPPLARSSASNGFPITPSDSANLSFTDSAGAVLPLTSISLFLPTSGTVQFTMSGDSFCAGQTLTLPLPAGYNPLQVTKVWATGTTATSMVGFTL